MNFFFITVGLVFFFNTLFAQQIDYRSIKPPEGKSLVYVVRPAIAGMAMKFEVFCNGENMGSTKGKQYLFTVLEPGEQIITNKAENKDAIVLKTGPNTIYFIKQKIKAGAISARAELITLNSNEGREALMKCNLSKKNRYIYNDIPETTTTSNNNNITDNIPPEITITYPNVSHGFKPVEQNKQITIQGSAKDASGIFEILVKEQGADIDALGNFTKNVLLAVGNNSFTVTATDLKQNSSTKTFTIERKSQQHEIVSTDNIPPEITITYPDVTRGFKIIETGKQVTITGKATDEDGIYEVLINNKDADIDANGNFSKTVFLSVGDNSFTVKATDILQNAITEEFTIVRQASQEVTPVVVNTQTKEPELHTGKYYALIIGVSDYDDPAINDLNNEPVNDAEELHNILITNYTFDKEDVILLKNPTYRTIVRSFDDLNKRITEEDNLLIFYAGHGYYSEEEEVGYWLPSDAELEYTDAWLYNSVLVDNIKKINTKHTFLIADACFSGSIFKTRSLSKEASVAYQKKYDLKSRNALTSGTLKTVPNKSMFFKFLSNRLRTNTQKFMSASELFLKIEIPVGNNSPNTPQFGDMQNVGDEGGDFIFIKK